MFRMSEKPFVLISAYLAPSEDIEGICKDLRDVWNPSDDTKKC